MKIFKQLRSLAVLALAGLLTTGALAQVTLNIATPAPVKTSPPLSLANTFTDDLAQLNMSLQTDYLFGSSATGSAPVIPIRNATDLATYFNPSPDAVGTAVQNEEVERFTTSFTAGNHVFNTSDLSLTATLEAGGTFGVVAKTLVGAVTNGSVLTFADTTGINDSMMIASIGSASIGTGTRVSSHDSTTVTLGSNVTLPNGTSVEFLPVYVVGASAITNGSLLTISAGVPSGLAVGSFYNNVTNGTFGIRRVQSIPDGTHIQLDGNVTVTAGNLVFFSPPVTSGQIWTKAGYQPGHNGASFIAMQLTATIPVTASRGAWPAWWLYSKTSDGFSFDASEIDMFEYFYTATSGSNAFTSNIHGGSYNATKFQRSIGSGSSKWDSFGFYRPGFDYASAQHTFELIWTPDKLYRFVDGQLIITTDYIWSSNDTAQMGLDLACGSFLTAFLGTNFYPQSTGQFPFAYKVSEIKIWQR